MFGEAVGNNGRKMFFVIRCTILSCRKTIETTVPYLIVLLGYSHCSNRDEKTSDDVMVAVAPIDPARSTLRYKVIPVFYWIHLPSSVGGKFSADVGHAFLPLCLEEHEPVESAYLSVPVTCAFVCIRFHCDDSTYQRLHPRIFVYEGKLVRICCSKAIHRFPPLSTVM
jgi:hypothetical protein